MCTKRTLYLWIICVYIYTCNCVKYIDTCNYANIFTTQFSHADGCGCDASGSRAFPHARLPSARSPQPCGTNSSRWATTTTSLAKMRTRNHARRQASSIVDIVHRCQVRSSSACPGIVTHWIIVTVKISFCELMSGVSISQTFYKKVQQALSISELFPRLSY